MNQSPSTPAEPERKSTLATLSLVFSCCSIITPFFLGSVGGIICGHLAMNEFRRDAGLTGRRKAKWGLIIGYSSIVVLPLLAYAVLALLLGGICGGGLLGH